MRTMWDFRFTWHWFGEFFSSRNLQCAAGNLPYHNNSYDFPTLGDEVLCFLEMSNYVKIHAAHCATPEDQNPQDVQYKELKLTRKVKWTCNRDYCSDSLYLKVGFNLMLRNNSDRLCKFSVLCKAERLGNWFQLSLRMLPVVHEY